VGVEEAAPEGPGDAGHGPTASAGAGGDGSLTVGDGTSPAGADSLGVSAGAVLGRVPESQMVDFVSRAAELWSEEESSEHEDQASSPESDGHQEELPIPGIGSHSQIVAAAAQYWSDESTDASPGKSVESQANEASVAAELWSDEDSADGDGASNGSDGDGSGDGSDRDGSGNGSDRDGSGNGSDRHGPNSLPVRRGADVQDNEVLAAAQLWSDEDDDASGPMAAATAAQLWSDESGEESGEEGSQDGNDSRQPPTFQADDAGADLLLSVTPSQITLSPRRFSGTDFSLGLRADWFNESDFNEPSDEDSDDNGDTGDENDEDEEENELDEAKEMSEELEELSE
jgi:hypothetical protein